MEDDYKIGQSLFPPEVVLRISLGARALVDAVEFGVRAEQIMNEIDEICKRYAEKLGFLGGLRYDELEYLLGALNFSLHWFRGKLPNEVIRTAVRSFPHSIYIGNLGVSGRNDNRKFIKVLFEKAKWLFVHLHVREEPMKAVNELFLVADSLGVRKYLSKAFLILYCEVEVQENLKAQLKGLFRDVAIGPPTPDTFRSGL